VAGASRRLALALALAAIIQQQHPAGSPIAFFSLSMMHQNIHTTLFATFICGANVCKWALCTTTSF
jgi:hypothetical protein